MVERRSYVGLKLTDSVYNVVGKPFGVSMEHATDNQGNVVAIVDRVKKPHQLRAVTDVSPYTATVLPGGARLEQHDLVTEYVTIRR